MHAPGHPKSLTEMNNKINVFLPASSIHSTAHASRKALDSQVFLFRAIATIDSDSFDASGQDQLNILGRKSSPF